MVQPVRQPSDASTGLKLKRVGEDYIRSRRTSLGAPPSIEQPRGTVAVLTHPATGRVASVDALRGFSMFWILGADALVISLCDILAGKGPVLSTVGAFVRIQFEHAAWEGFRFYDLIFPLFIFVTGVAIVFSLTRLVELEGRAIAHRRALVRSFVLFGLGVICYGGLSQTWQDVRLAGVLQRIAICYLFASLLFLNLRLSGLIVAFVSLLVGYWALMVLVPVPEIGAGSMARDANLANWIDARFLPGMKWEESWDPEGLLSTLPAIGTCLLGVFAGLLLRDERLTPEQKSLWLVVAGAIMMAAGFAWGLQFPVIKNLWTSSFVLVAGGFSAMLLGLFHHVMDVRGRQGWATVFIWIGASAITLYLINMVVGFDQVALRLVGGDFSRSLDQYLTKGAGDLVVYAVAVTLAVALARFLYRRRIFLRI